AALASRRRNSSQRCRARAEDAHQSLRITLSLILPVVNLYTDDCYFDGGRQRSNIETTRPLAVDAFGGVIH
ncbi:hypothetical protein, partial [Paraburkholderia dipogonis]|uniref:hypothetical protein n=1 Tax=Paraburkholderia dipogonis TaxID=1211383 RepID=UPI0038B8A9ED